MNKEKTGEGKEKGPDGKKPIADRKEYQRLYYKKNKKAITRRKRMLRLQSRDKINSEVRERYANDPEFRMARKKSYRKLVKSQEAKYESDPEYRKVADERMAKRKEKFDNEYYRMLNIRSREKHGKKYNQIRKELYASDPEYRKVRQETYSNYNSKRLAQKRESLTKDEMMERLATTRVTANERDYTSLEVRYILGLSHNDFYKMIKIGALPGTKKGNHYAINESAILTYINGE